MNGKKYLNRLIVWCDLCSNKSAYIITNNKFVPYVSLQIYFTTKWRCINCLRGGSLFYFSHRWLWWTTALQFNHVWRVDHRRQDLPGPLGLRDILWTNRICRLHHYCQMGEWSSKMATHVAFIVISSLRHRWQSDSSFLTAAEDEAAAGFVSREDRVHTAGWSGLLLRRASSDAAILLWSKSSRLVANVKLQ